MCVSVCVYVCGVVVVVVCRWSCGIVACLLLSGGLSSDVETSSGTCERFMVTPAVCPRLFESLTTLTFGAQRRNHTVSPAFDHRKKKGNKESSLSTCDQQFIMNYQEHNRSWKGSASVLASMRWLLCSARL